MTNIKDHLKERILVLDGAMGTMIQRYELKEEDFRGDLFQNHHMPLQGNNDILCLTKPEIIKAIHGAYFKAGADIVETNTFSGTRIAQADYGLEEHVYELNKQAAALAKEVAETFTAAEPHKPRFVAGAIGPTNKTASISPDVNDPGFRGVTFDELKANYKEQAQGLKDGGADIFLIETIFDTLNAKAALMALAELEEETGDGLPIMISGTITDASGRTLSGQTTEAFMISLSHLPLLSIGLNCALGAELMRPYIQTLADKSDSFVSAYPNAGLPNEFGEYDESPEEMAEQVRSFMEAGLINIIGGCCGTSPDHIQALAELAQQYQPRKIAAIHD